MGLETKREKGISRSLIREHLGEEHCVPSRAGTVSLQATDKRVWTAHIAFMPVSERGTRMSHAPSPMLGNL